MYSVYTTYMTRSVWFNSVTEGRTNLRKLLDAAAHGVPAGLRREHAGFAIIDAIRLRRLLELHSGHAEVIPEADGWSILIPGMPIAADGATLTKATEEMVDALREYAADWIDHLRAAPNHADNWWLVQLVELSSDEELAEWLTAGQLTTS